MSDYFYDYEYDTTYCYPQANVLKNKLNIKDADSLLEVERSITALRILELKQSYPDGKLDFSYFKHLHFYIFQDIYGWAGKTRTVNISKGSPFCLCQFIDDQAIELFQKLERENYLVMLKILRKGFRFTCLSLMQFTHLGRAMAERNGCL